MRDWATSSGVKNTSVKVVEDSGPESTTYKTTKVTVSKAKKVKKVIKNDKD